MDDRVYLVLTPASFNNCFLGRSITGTQGLIQWVRVAWLVGFSIFLKIIFFIFLFLSYFSPLCLWYSMSNLRAGSLFYSSLYPTLTASVLALVGPQQCLVWWSMASLSLELPRCCPSFSSHPIIVRCLYALRSPTPDPTPYERITLSPGVCISTRGHCFVRGCSSLFFNTKLDINFMVYFQF